MTQRLNAEKIFEDTSVFMAFMNATARYQDWRQVVDATMHFIFGMHEEFSHYSYDVNLRADLRKHIKQLWNGASMVSNENLRGRKYNAEIKTLMGGTKIH